MRSKTCSRPFGLLALLALSVSLASPGAAQELRLNRTIELLEAGLPTFGIATGDFSLVNARELSDTDLDFVIIDMEHAPYDVERLQQFVLGMVDVGRAVEKGSTQLDVTPIVRIPMNGSDNLQFLVKQVLDVGVYGVMFPFVSNRDQAMNAVTAMRYPQNRGDAQMEPVGRRGSSPGNARWIWGAENYTSRADVWPHDPDGELLAVLQIENREGVENIEEIASVPGVGIIFVGPSDLSNSYGVSSDHPEMVAAIDRVLAACQANDVPCGITTSANSVEDRLAQGFRWVTVSWWGAAGISPNAARGLEVARRVSGRDGGN